MIKIPLIILSLISSVIFSVHAEQKYFVKYPEINEKVETFATSFVQNVMPEITQSQIRFDFSEGQNGIKNTDLSYGKIKGSYLGIAQLPEDTKEASIAMDFELSMNKAPKKEGIPSEFEIHFTVNGKIDNTSNFMNFFLGTLMPQCQEEKHASSKGIDGDVCKVISDNKIDVSKSSVDNAFEILTLWKMKFLERISKIDRSDFSPIRNDFINYLDQRINIVKDEKKLNLSINLESLSKDFSDKAKGFLKETKLIDYSLNSIDVEMNDSEILFSGHVLKLHVVSSVNKYMELAASLTSIIENPKNGESIGIAIRDGDGAASGVGILDKASIGVAGAMIKLRGTENGQDATEEEEGLGLD